MGPSSGVIGYTTAGKWCSGVSVVEGTAWLAVVLKTCCITPEDGPIRPKHVELYTTYNKFIRCCIKFDTHLPYDYDARLHKPQRRTCSFIMKIYQA
jgi:hypothetical protein